MDFYPSWSLSHDDAKFSYLWVASWVFSLKWTYVFFHKNESKQPPFVIFTMNYKVLILHCTLCWYVGMRLQKSWQTLNHNKKCFFSHPSNLSTNNTFFKLKYAYSQRGSHGVPWMFRVIISSLCITNPQTLVLFY